MSGVDSLPEATRRKGLNMSGHRWAHIQVVPDGAGPDPSVAVLWWSEAAGAFIQEHTPIIRAGLGGGVGYEFTVECLGRIMFVAATALTGVARVYVSGDGVEYR